MFYFMLYLVSIKLDASNVLLYRSLIQSLGVYHHLIEVEPPCELLVDAKEIDVINMNHNIWVNNNMLLIMWLLSVMANDVLSMNVGVEIAF